MENSILIIVVGILAAIGGYIFGMADKAVTGKVKDKLAESNVQVVAEQSALSVVFDLDQNIKVSMEGLPVTPDTLAPEQRERLKKILAQMPPYIAASAPKPLEPAPVAAPKPASMAVQSVVENSAPKPRIDIRKGAAMVLTDDVVRKVEPRPKSIVGMIDDVLQAKLENSPLKEKKIALKDGPHGEVIVVVGTLEYDGIDAVPDAEIQAIIRQSVADWEKTPTHK
jgi:hypothetical protein